MKRLLVIICTISSLLSYGQDYDMLNFINIYRAKNGCESVIHSKDLEEIAKAQNTLNTISDSVAHSHKASEIALKGNCLPATKTSRDSFVNFLQKYFKLDYKDPKTDAEVLTLIKLYSIYLFSTSKSHNNILLGEYNYVGFDIVTNSIKYKSNVIKIGGKEYKLNNAIPHHDVNFYVVVDFRK